MCIIIKLWNFICDVLSLSSKQAIVHSIARDPASKLAYSPKRCSTWNDIGILDKFSNYMVKKMLKKMNRKPRNIFSKQ